MRRNVQIVGFLLCAACITVNVKGQDFDPAYQEMSSGNIVQDKNAYLLTVMEELPPERFAGNPVFTSMAKQKMAALKGLAAGQEDLSALKFPEEEIQALKENLRREYDQNPIWDEIVERHLIPSGYYTAGINTAPQEVLATALEISLHGVNRMLDTYGMGIPGRYGFIDSACFDVHSAPYRNLLVQEADSLTMILPAYPMFFQPSLKLAMVLLKLNRRDEVARYEPMETGVNKRALEKIKSIRWAAYPYAVILVPGNGPKGTEALSENAKPRLKEAVAAYHRKLAPFIVLSGGNVHPYMTPYNEAAEMKKELMRTFGIPEEDILMEPHARHTTTNLRNTNRLFYRYSFPMGKKVLITTDKKQANKIADPEFGIRCLQEIGHEPYLRLTRVSDTNLEYFPVLRSLQTDPTDPLDP